MVALLQLYCVRHVGIMPYNIVATLYIKGRRSMSETKLVNKHHMEAFDKLRKEEEIIECQKQILSRTGRGSADEARLCHYTTIEKEWDRL